MKDEKKAPKLRFKGFTDDWEQCKLSDISEKSYEKNTDNKYSTVLTNSAEYGIVKQRDFFDKDIANSSNISGYYVVRKNYFVYNPRISNQAKFGPINRNKLDESGIMSPLYLVFTVHDIDESFLETLFQTTTWHRFMYQNGDTGARADRFAIKDSTFMSMPIKVPSLEEQHKLALAFQKLDQTITLHEEKKHQLERLKSALLQKMFADKSGYLPVRFEGFSNEWEHCKLGDVADITTGSRNHQDSVTDGKYPFFVRSDKVERLNEYDFDTKAILVPGDGRIGEIFHYYNGKFALHQRVYKVDNFNGINELFLLGLFKYSFKEHALRLNAQGTVPSLRLPMFTNWSISVPMITEQERIGVFFQKLERTISLYDHKLELLNKVKRSMLQAMFI
ncbi:restriction endonuclease subunit S [Lactobacillus delbrueckii]|uniref:restriction endonuclease subunit S n=1 Tax=Lactobacillus delbrueckii TaxID=1584 RepID=UPI000E5A05B1|nr:restriction endonuclease subunit S [Lactobacillus delbrueckii]RHX66341.1 restriction endonuclease subunit S [Lactobacillus delbrueckii]